MSNGDTATLPPGTIQEKNKTLNPIEMLMNAAKAFQQFGAAPGAQPGAAGGGPSVIPGIVGGLPPQLHMPPPVPGGIPTASAGIPGLPQQRPPLQPAGYRTGFEFSTPEGKRAAIVEGAIGGVAEAVGEFKQRRAESKLRGAQGWTSRYLMLMQQDPEGKNPEIQKMIQEIRGNPKVHKLWDKANQDPTSPEALGVNQAYMQAQAKAQADFQNEVKTRQLQQAMSTMLTGADAQSAERIKAGLQPTADAALGAAATVVGHQQTLAQQRPTFTNRGAHPTMWDPVTLKEYAPEDKDAPESIHKALVSEQQSTFALWQKQADMAARAQDASMRRLLLGLDARDRNKAIDAIGPAFDAQFYLDRMRGNYAQNTGGKLDQQAQLGMLFDHLRVVGLAPGGTKGQARLFLGKTFLEDAESSDSMIARIAARGGFTYDKKGYLSGVVLTPDEMTQMVEQAERNYDTMRVTGINRANLYGVQPKGGKTWEEVLPDRKMRDQQLQSTDPNSPEFWK